MQSSCIPLGRAYLPLTHGFLLHLFAGPTWELPLELNEPSTEKDPLKQRIASIEAAKGVQDKRVEAEKKRKLHSGVD